MKCAHCDRQLEESMTFCPRCGARADGGLPATHFRDLGEDASLPCPQCATPLRGIEFDTLPPVRIERCTTCRGLFFNPGEIEALLDAPSDPLLLLDPVRQQAPAVGHGRERAVFYQKCPCCGERMSHVNFGGRSGVIVDRCGIHGVWLEDHNIRRLAGWWRGGGKLIHQQHSIQRTKLTHGAAVGTAGAFLPERPAADGSGIPEFIFELPDLLEIIAACASLILDD